MADFIMDYSFPALPDGGPGLCQGQRQRCRVRRQGDSVRSSSTWVTESGRHGGCERGKVRGDLSNPRNPRRPKRARAKPARASARGSTSSDTELFSIVNQRSRSRAVNLRHRGSGPRRQTSGSWMMRKPEVTAGERSCPDRRPMGQNPSAAHPRVARLSGQSLPVIQRG